jgi:hypothetical protein
MQRESLHRSLSARARVGVSRRVRPAAGWCVALGLAVFGGCASAEGFEDETTADTAGQVAAGAELADTVTTK